jgi:hypothetical protein
MASKAVQAGYIPEGCMRVETRGNIGYGCIRLKRPDERKTAVPFA